MTEETIDPAHDTTSLLVAQLVSALALAVAVAAATVVVVAWVGTWEDVEEVSLAHFLFWPLATAALTLQITAHRLRQPAATSGTSA